MKIIIPALLLILLASCTKDAVTSPKSINQTIVANAAVSYKDNSISVIDFKAQADKTNIKVTFTTLYEKNIVKLEVLRGLTDTNLCSIYKQDVSGNTAGAIEYSTSDANEQHAAALYYMVKYTLANGDWGYTPVFELSL